jgi:hypothetical protein
MDVSSIYKELSMYRYSSATEVDSESNYSYNQNNALYDSSRRANEDKQVPQTTNKPINDKLEISAAAQKKQSENSSGNSSNNQNNSKNQDQSKQNSSKNSSNGSTLSKDDQKMVEDLRKRDSEVRSHEAAHQSAGGGLVRGGATFSYQSGPDGKQYAIGGEVQIDTSGDSNDPQATISKMQQVKQAALAPADPSSQDRAVAQMAASVEADARAKLSQKNSESNSNTPNENVDQKQAPDFTQSTNVNPDGTKKAASENEGNTKKSNTAANLIKSYQTNQEQNSQAIGNILNKISSSPSLESLKTRSEQQFKVNSLSKQISFVY